jgi:hypothetical protein
MSVVHCPFLVEGCFLKKTVVFCNCIPYLCDIIDIIFGETAICFRDWNGTEQDRLHLQSVFTKRVTRSQKYLQPVFLKPLHAPSFGWK